MSQDIPKLLRQYVIQELPTDNKEWEILMLDTADEIEKLRHALHEAAGYISTYEPWIDMHPEAAYQYFLHQGERRRGAKNNYMPNMPNISNMTHMTTSSHEEQA
jgi:hypothetical protein